MVLKNRSKIILGLLLDNKLYIDKNNTFSVLELVLDISNTNIIKSKGLYYNNNYLLINNDSEVVDKDNIIYINIIEERQYKDENILAFPYKYKYLLDKTTLYVKDFKDTYIVLDT